MDFVIFTFLSFACSAAMGIVAFMVGRCSRRLPVDGILPRVVHTARFGEEKDEPPVPEPAESNWPHAR